MSISYGQILKKSVGCVGAAQVPGCLDVGSDPDQTSASDCLERLVPEMIYYVSRATLNYTHSVTHLRCFTSREGIVVVSICVCACVSLCVCLSAQPRLHTAMPTSLDCLRVPSHDCTISVLLFISLFVTSSVYLSVFLI